METNNNKSNQENQKQHHHTLMEDIRETFEKLDTEFPLSGGETDEDLDKVTHTGENDKGKDHPKTSFFDDLDTEFPLSGGETER